MKQGLLLGLAVVAAACGGGNGGGSATNTPASSSGAIKSMPPYPAKTAETAPEPPPKPKEPREICAGATPVEMSPKKAALLEKGGFATSARELEPEREIRSAKNPYTMADLDALAKKSSWEELLGSAEDIPPAQRGPAWEKLVEKAASGYMQSLTTGSASFEGVWTSQSLVKRYPFLAKSQDFMTKRGEAGKAAAERCLHDAYRGQHCIDMMKEFLKTAGTTPEVGLAFGKITRRNQNHYVAVPFFKWALDSAAKNGASFCGDEDLKMAVIAGLGLPPDYDNAVDSRQITANTCWDALKAEVRKELVEHPEGYYRDNACAVMKAKGDL